ncbi:hypothetical protein BGY98DRAFT_570945 [Russula aff. rugulosa BPL654]|nr:hypothetical protein BGY98DRAFT_570945 [Russula aff. rugulosa BPL654]
MGPPILEDCQFPTSSLTHLLTFDFPGHCIAVFLFLFHRQLHIRRPCTNPTMHETRVDLVTGAEDVHVGGVGEGAYAVGGVARMAGETVYGGAFAFKIQPNPARVVQRRDIWSWDHRWDTEAGLWYGVSGLWSRNLSLLRHPPPRLRYPPHHHHVRLLLTTSPPTTPTRFPCSIRLPHLPPRLRQ